MGNGMATSSPQEMCLKEARPLGVMEQLRHRRYKAVAELQEIDATIAMFEKHPEFEQCLSQLSRVGIYR
jgi:hypothetical protein